MGASDKIMPPRLARRFINNLNTARLVILEKGHKLIDNENAQQIAAQLL
jgi:hypothetical protein